MPKVLIHPATYDNVLPAVRRAFELFPLDLRGKKVLIKPNVLRASKPEEGIVTHPAVLQAVVAQVEAMAPAEIVVGDNPGLMGYGANERCFTETGLMAAAKGYYRNIGDDSRQVDFNPQYMPRVSLSRAVLDADVIISLPKFKTHGLTVLTGAIKNSYGLLPGAQKAKLHKAAGSPRRFQQVVVEVFNLRVPDLFIMDAVVGMEGNGPASPDLRDIGLILAADNAVAMDTVVAHMMGCVPDQLPFLQKAREMGLGDCDLAAIELEGALRRVLDFKLPPMEGAPRPGQEVVQQLLHSKTVLRPKADPALCTACGTCVDQCPVGALRMVDDLPVVDPDLCILCFCCQEICPEKAMVVA
ncbi:DUF362 domain-containing protein [Desulfatitalea alkaliphila]|uniref:DUF362 domain-containing protein n=1 Tax=Desulfatitalea alkaliphila TaxID=2929485 RepID=A0AA41R6V1_9BACT|nr:DUF362 domain-containing protein [Desulfatitalea alkaliphila]MCJ8502295.1 DUF362 domain-containing protein [Desulfatitalea alkaliphila]